jgi:hypothetical protein
MLRSSIGVLVIGTCLVGMSTLSLVVSLFSFELDGTRNFHLIVHQTPPAVMPCPQSRIASRVD